MEIRGYKREKRAQEEIVGFILIIVIVAVIGLVFLGISLRKPTNFYRKSPAEIPNFLQSLKQYTTECKIEKTEYGSIEDLIKECYINANKKCLDDDRFVCDVLETDLTNILKYSFPVSEQSARKAYELSVYFERSGGGKIQNIINIQEGNCTGVRKKDNKITWYFDPGTGIGDNAGEIVMRFEICYSSI